MSRGAETYLKKKTHKTKQKQNQNKQTNKKNKKQNKKHCSTSSHFAFSPCKKVILQREGKM